MNNQDLHFEKRYVANFIAFLVTSIFTLFVIYFLQSILTVACVLILLLSVLSVSAAKRSFTILRWASVVFVGVASALGCIYALWGGIADWKGTQAHPISGGIIFGTDQGIVIRGPINFRNYAAWAEVYNGNAQYQTLPVFLNSPGGDLAAAQLIAADIAKNKLEVRVAADAQCRSACTLIFAAGTQWFADPEAHFQFHSSRHLVSAPHLPPVVVLKQDDPDQIMGLKAFPELLRNLDKLGAWRNDQGVSGCAQRLHDNQDATFLTLRKISQTPSPKSEN